MSETVQLRQASDDNSGNTTEYESPDIGTQAICAMYLANEIASQFDEFIEVELSESAVVNATLDNVSNKGSGNYAVFSTPGDSITSLYVSHDTWTEVFDEEVETDEDGNVLNAPESIGVSIDTSDGESFESIGASEDEADALIAGSASDDSEEESVEVSDEEVGLVE